ncbi:hypothetical protein [Halopseudomonas litoralis]|nr:hypothetical protein [Halopseudomonas litoralis]
MRHPLIPTIRLALALVVAALVLVPAVVPARVPVVVLAVLALVLVVLVPVVQAVLGRALVVNRNSAAEAGLVSAFFVFGPTKGAYPLMEFQS